MTQRQQAKFEVFFLLLIPAMLILALALDRWYGVLPLVGMLYWMIRRWLPIPAQKICQPQCS